tara:strand:+ start:18256 stop:18726 length:471 start_codon:yes stop_codon:yes gene_type:complete
MGFKPRKKATSPKLRETIEARVDFLNVDLELEGPKNLAPLVRALGDVYVLHITSEAPFVANLELGSEPEPGRSVASDAALLEARVRSLLALVEGLDEPARELWDACTKRSFNVGLQSGLAPAYTQYALPSSLLQRLGAVGAELVVTLYGARYQEAT